MAYDPHYRFTHADPFGGFEEIRCSRVARSGTMSYVGGQPSTAGAGYVRGDRVRYVAPPVFDRMIETGDIGVVDKVADGWVYAWWPRSGLHGVPGGHVERAAP